MNLKQIITYCYIIFSVLLVVISCESADPDLNESKSGIEISFYDAACLEAWIYVDFSRNESCSFRLDYDKFSREYELTGNDTILYIDSLSPGNIYQVNAWMWKNYSWLESGSAGFRTLEPTSHDFTWEIHHPGDGEWGGYFNDVSITDDGRIKVVGKIMSYDENGHSLLPYCNYAEWDGVSWEKQTVYFKDSYGESYAESRCVHDLGGGKTIISKTGAVKIFDGNNWSQPPSNSVQGSPLGTGNVLWGFAPENFFLGGGSGKIIHWRGNMWNIIETGVESDIVNLVGYVNNLTQKQEILATGFNDENWSESSLLLISDDGTAKKIESDLVGVWTKTGHPIFGSNDKLVSNKTGKWLPLEGVENYNGSIKGNALNDIFVHSGFNLAHYNGIDWSIISLPYFINSFDVKRDMIVVVGTDGKPPLAIIGKR